MSLDLDAIKERLAAATPGPWVVDEGDDDYFTSAVAVCAPKCGPMKLIEAFAGSLALSAYLAGGEAPIGYMGAKRKLAPYIARAIGLERGTPSAYWCADAGPWGDFWRTFAEHGPMIVSAFRSAAAAGRIMPELWRQEVQRPPDAEPVQRAVQFLVLQARTASATPIWWDPAREQWVGEDERGCVYRQQQSHAGQWVMPAGSPSGHVGSATPRGRHSNQRGTGAGRVTGLIHPATVADRLDALWSGLGGRLHVHHGDTAELLDLLPADLTGYVVYLDPPYVGCTPYAAACSRERVLELARAYHARGAIVVISEGEPMPIEGWHTVDLAPARAVKRWTAAQRGEWLTMSVPPAKRPAAQLTLWAGAAA